MKVKHQLASHQAGNDGRKNEHIRHVVNVNNLDARPQKKTSTSYKADRQEHYVRKNVAEFIVVPDFADIKFLDRYTLQHVRLGRRLFFGDQDSDFVSPVHERLGFE